MKRIGLYLFIIGITFIKAYGQEDSGPCQYRSGKLSDYTG